MLRLPAFRYLRAATLDEAAAMLAGEGAGEGLPVRLVAGGTDLWPNMKRRHQKAATVVSLMGIGGLAGISRAAGSGNEGSPVGPGLRIGATTLLDDVARAPLVAEHFPALARAVASISSPPLRNMGTLGGNLCLDTRCTYYNQSEEWRRAIDYCMKEEGKICWVAPSSPRCWAHSASDSAPILTALGATVRLVSRGGQRELPVEALFQDDGIAYLAKRPDEILAEIQLPPEAAAGACRSAFWKLRRRGAIDFAVLSVAVAVWYEGTRSAPAGSAALGEQRVARARIVLGSVGSAPIVVDEAAKLLEGNRLTAELAAEAGRLARRVATPMDNTDFQAQWRGTMAGRYTEAALREVAGLAPGLPVPS